MPWQGFCSIKLTARSGYLPPLLTTELTKIISVLKINMLARPAPQINIDTLPAGFLALVYFFASLSWYSSIYRELVIIKSGRCLILDKAIASVRPGTDSSFRQGFAAILKFSDNDHTR